MPVFRKDTSRMMTGATLTFGPESLMADHGSSRARNLKPAAPAALTSMELLVRAKTGDELALNDLCARYLPRLQKWAHGRLPAYARGALDTYDIVQETLTKAVRRHDGSFGGFLHTTLRNYICDQVRSARRRPTTVLDSDRVAEDPTPFELAVGQETAERYEAALQRLKPADREAIVA